MNVTTLLVLQGVPASGKSTYAKSLDPNIWVRVNRDDIRRMMGGYIIKDREQFVTETEKSMVAAALRSGRNVVVDDTNLNPDTERMWREVSKECDAVIQFSMFRISMKEALERDASREFPVGKKVIERFFKKYFPSEYKKYYTDPRVLTNEFGLQDTKPDVILCDLDGTLALHNGRNPFEYDEIATDVINKRLDRLLDSVMLPIIFVSGREGTDEAVKNTKKWLSEYGYGDNSLLMRKKGDHKPDDIVKKEIYETYIKPNYNVVAVFDDRNKVVKMWREQGLLCCQVNEGDF